MSVYAVSHDIWLLNEESDRRFRRAAYALLIPIILISLIIPYLELAGLQRGGGDEGTSRYVELLQEEAAALDEQEEEPAPAEVDEPEPTPEPEPEVEQPVEEVVEPTPPQPVTQPEVVDRTEKAREVASQSGVLAFADELNDLRNPALSGMDAAQPLSSGALTRKSSSSDRGSADSIASSAAASSGGVQTQQVQRTQSGTGIGTRRTTTVEKPKGFGEDKSQIGQGGDKLIAGRTLEELQLVFDRNKGSFYALYTRALRSNPGLAGTVNVSLTIDPSGRVTACEVVSSTLNDPDLERKIVARIMLINFGAKSVPAQTFPSYPLHFFPAN